MLWSKDEEVSDRKKKRRGKQKDSVNEEQWKAKDSDNLSLI